MKITSVRPWVVARPPVPGEMGEVASNPYVFVQVDTDAGITGWGEITTYPGSVANRLIAGVIREASELVVGEDPSRIEALWNKLFRQFTYTGTRGAISAMISGIDIALWDIRGKALGQPVYKLLGGEVRGRIALYTHPPRPDTPEKAAADALEIVESGHRALKLDPFWEEMADKSTSYLDGQIRPETAAKAVEIIAAIREAVGPEIEVLIDAHGNFNVPTAVYLAQSLAPYGIHWFEEPVPPESYHALKQVRDQVPVRICVGERLHTRFEFLPVFEGNLADFVMPDVTWTGRHQRAEEDFDDGGGVLRAGLAPRRQRPYQCARGRARDDDGAELLQAGDDSLRPEQVQPDDRRAAGRAARRFVPVGSAWAGRRTEPRIP